MRFLYALVFVNVELNGCKCQFATNEKDRDTTKIVGSRRSTPYPVATRPGRFQLVRAPIGIGYDTALAAVSLEVALTIHFTSFEANGSSRRKGASEAVCVCSMADLL